MAAIAHTLGQYYKYPYVIYVSTCAEGIPSESAALSEAEGFLADVVIFFQT